MLRSYEPRFFLDRCFLSELPSEVADAVDSRGLAMRGEQKKVSFVGVILTNDTLNIFLPRSSVVPSCKTQKFQVASNVMLAIEKYFRSSSKTLINQSDEGNDHKHLMQLTLLKNLFLDFIQNGIYSKHKQVGRINQGKTNWKKTVNRFNPMHEREGQSVYIDYYGINREYFSICEVAKIHAKVIRIIYKNFSWLLLGAQHIDVSELSDYQNPSGDINFQILQLRREISVTYFDRDIRLINMLIDFLEKLSGLNRSPFAIGLTKFHFCWEAMLASVLEFVEPINSKLPIPVYIKENGRELAMDAGMRTDIFMHDHTERLISIVDAKYYAATEAKDSPRWKDIVKQLFYEQAIESLALNASIKNVFVFPGNRNNLNRVVLKNRHLNKQKVSSFAHKFKPIYCYYVNPLEVMEYYIKNKKMEDFSLTLLANR